MNKITKNGKVTIIDDSYVLKPGKSLFDLENYLRSRSFNGFIPILDRSDDGINKYPYKENFTIDKDQLGIDIITTLSLLHNKTSYKKEVGNKKTLEIYDNLNGYIKYLDDYFLKLLEEYEYIEFPSPSNLLYMSNYKKIKEVLLFCKNELDKWYKLVDNQTSKRVSLVHGNMNLEHALKNDEVYFCSWDKTNIDTPIVDIINFYHNEYLNLNFSSILSTYFEKCELLEDEKKLLFINIAIPILPTLKNSELDKVIEINKILEYINRTERLIRPYYLEENKEK